MAAAGVLIGVSAHEREMAKELLQDGHRREGEKASCFVADWERRGGRWLYGAFDHPASRRRGEDRSSSTRRAPMYGTRSFRRSCIAALVILA
jgi:hypothetical protein